MSNNEDIVYRLRKRAEIRRQIPDRKSVQEGKPDRIADILEEAASEIERLRAGAEIHAGDGGYSVGTQEEYEAFVKNRNFQIPLPAPKKIYTTNVASKSKLEDGKNQ